MERKTSKLAFGKYCRGTTPNSHLPFVFLCRLKCLSLPPAHSTWLAGRNPKFWSLLKERVVNFDGGGHWMEMDAWGSESYAQNFLFWALSSLGFHFFLTSIGAEGTYIPALLLTRWSPHTPGVWEYICTDKCRQISSHWLSSKLGMLKASLFLKPVWQP